MIAIPSHVDDCRALRTDYEETSNLLDNVDRAIDAFEKSIYPLKTIRCSMDSKTLRLDGSVSRYFHVQMAIEIARKLANGRRMEVNLEVVAPSESSFLCDSSSERL